jgi:hypothetical protein
MLLRAASSISIRVTDFKVYNLVYLDDVIFSIHFDIHKFRSHWIILLFDYVYSL